MRNNKKVFWISLFLGILSIGLIILLHCLSIKYIDQKDIYTAIENVFISLVGGTWLSMITSRIGFCYTRKQHIIDFCEEYGVLVNKIRLVINWFSIQYNDIKYENFSELVEKMPEKDADEFLDKTNKFNDEKVRVFYERIKEIEKYDFNKLYFIMDDFCSFRLKRKNNIKIKMIEMFKLVKQYDIAEMKSEHYIGYEEGIYDEWLLYDCVCPRFKEIIKMIPMRCLLCKKQEFIDLTQINKYLNKIYSLEIEDTREK